MSFTLSKTKLAGAIVATSLLVPATAYATHVFDDVPDGKFYAEPVEWAYDNSITTGKTPTQFDPEGNVTRGESVTFLKRYDDNIVQPALDDLADDLTAAESDIDALEADKIGHGEIVLNHGTSDVKSNGATVGELAAGNTLSGSGWAQISLHGPSMIDGVEYGLSSIRSCTSEPSGDLVVSYMETYEMGEGFPVARDTSPDADGCFDIDVNHSGAMGYDLVVHVSSTSGQTRWNGAQSTWVPVADLALTTASADQAGASSGAAG